MLWWREFSAYCASWCAGAVALRLMAAFMVGIVVGIDRGIKRRGAGIKTHTLVCLGAALVMTTGQFIYVTTGGANSIDRLGAQVISGVGFLGVGTILVFGSEDGKVYCLNAADGAKEWEYTAGGSVPSDPLVDQERVYIGSGDGKISCIDVATGLLQWSYQTDGVMRQRPTISNGVVYAYVRDTYIWYALDAQTGELRWRGNAETDESLFVCGDVRPIIAGGKLWCIDAQNTRPGYLDLQTGELAWTGALEKVSSRGMATNGELVFYTSNNGRQLTAFDSDTAQVVWQKDLRYNSRDGDLQAMQIDCALVYENGMLFHLAERGRVTAMNPITGATQWCFDAAGFPERVFWSTPEVNGNLLLASGIDGNLYAVEIS